MPSIKLLDQDKPVVPIKQRIATPARVVPKIKAAPSVAQRISTPRAHFLKDRKSTPAAKLKKAPVVPSPPAKRITRGAAKKQQQVLIPKKQFSHDKNELDQ